MKKFLALLLILGGFVLAAGTYEETHRAELNKLRRDDLIQPDLAEMQWYFTPGAPKDDWRTAPPSPDAIRFNGRDDGTALNLDRVAPGGPRRSGDEGVVHILFHSSRSGVTRLGVSTDWWCEVCVNGELVMSTLAKGNGSGSPYVPEDHPFFAPVRKGLNQIAVRVRRGTGDWRFVCGRTRFLRPPLPEVEDGPWLLAPDTTALSVLFRTAGNISAGVRYRPRGQAEYRTVFEQRGGHIAEKELHRVALTGLVPGTEYEYQIVMLAPDDANVRVVDPAVRCFRTPAEDAPECRFLFLADLQFPPKKQLQIFEALLRHAHAQDCDFIVLGGDLCNSFMPEVIEKNLLARLPAGKPVVVLRGNHELRGPDADRFQDFFAWPDGATYALFRWGDTAFLALDTYGKHSRHPTQNDMGRMVPEVFADEAAFVRRAVESPRWTTAARRVVLAHGAADLQPLSQPKEVPAAELTACWFAALEPRSRPDFWLTGHTHQYTRTIPGTERIASWTPLTPPLKNAPDYPFPVLTVAGPNRKEPVQASVFRVEIDAEKVRVRAFAPDGRCFEDLEYRRGGETLEHRSLSSR